jgi:hypothetical protein
MSEYWSRFFPYYNAASPDPAVGAPLMSSMVFVAAPGNHDIWRAGPIEHAPDGFGYFAYWAHPHNGPLTRVGEPHTPSLVGQDTKALGALRAALGDGYPRTANYSFDYGDSHWTILDSNPYVDWTVHALRAWVERDLAGARGKRWRFVLFHHPGVHSSMINEAQRQTQMRLLSDLFQAYDVAVVFSGHYHNYQRSRPARFSLDSVAWRAQPPRGATHGEWGHVANTAVPGRFTIDTSFDGATRTKPDGVIYVVSGAGGAGLYEPEYTDTPELWQPFTVRFVADVHSFTLVDVESDRLTLRQLSDRGAELDRIVVTKGVSLPAAKAKPSTHAADTALPLAPLRTVSFTVDEGSAMSVDVSPDGRSLAFNLLGQIFTVPIAGGKATQLTTGPAYAVRPLFTRDGRAIVFQSDQGGSLTIWRVPISGGLAVRADPADTVGHANIFLENPDTLWAPQGKYGVLLPSKGARCDPRALGRPGPDSLRVVRLVERATQQVTRLAARASCEYRLSGVFTPDGRAVMAAYGGKLRRIEVPSGRTSVVPFEATVTLRIRPLVRFPHRISEDPLVHARRITWPRVSPDGARVVFSAFDKLWVMPFSGGTPRRLTTFAVTELEPVWSPDGRHIAFTTWTDSGSSREMRPQTPRAFVSSLSVLSMAATPSSARQRSPI